MVVHAVSSRPGIACMEITSVSLMMAAAVVAAKEAAGLIKVAGKAAKGIGMIGNASSAGSPRLSIRIICSVSVLKAMALAGMDFATSTETLVAVIKGMIASLSTERKIPVGLR